MVAARLANLKEGRPKTASVEAVSQVDMSQSDAAKKMRVNRSSVQRAKKVLDGGHEEIARMVDEGELSLRAGGVVSAPAPPWTTSPGATRRS
jgi:predicted DNA-binding protein (UPF0251 family)